MNKTVSAEQVEGRFREILERVFKSHEIFIIEEDGKPVAMLTPVADSFPVALDEDGVRKEVASVFRSSWESHKNWSREDQEEFEKEVCLATKEVRSEKRNQLESDDK